MHPQSDQLSAALETVIDHCAGMIRRVAWRHRLSDADVDEVMQEVRIRLWRAHQSALNGQTTAPVGTFTQVTTGFSHSCGVRTDGDVVCWGFDGYGQVSGSPGDDYTYVRQDVGWQLPPVHDQAERRHRALGHVPVRALTRPRR